MNLGSDRDWSFQGQPNPHVNDRSIPFSMGKVLGGGSSINVMVWARGHQHDWDLFAAEVNDPAWGYESVLNLYRRLEDWHGAPDPMYRGTGGPVFVQPAPDPNPIAPATIALLRSVGIPTFENPNGRMMEAVKGAAISDVRVRNGKREVMPGNLKGAELESFIRDAATSFWHETCTAKMGQDAMSVVDSNLRVYGIDNLRIADGSILPRVTTGNTMAPCVIVGERAAEILHLEHQLQTTVKTDSGVQ